MSKLNPKGKKAVATPKIDIVKKWYSNTKTREGQAGFTKEPEQVLYELCVGSLYGTGDSFYSAPDEIMVRLIDAITLCVQQNKIEFVANLCVYARKEMHMRSMPIVAAVHLMYTLRQEGKSMENMRHWVKSIVGRADELLDFYAAALDLFGDKKKLPQAFKRGIADAMNKFDAYQYAKYDRPTGLKFKDLLRIVHPKAKDAKQGEVFAKIMAGTLEAPRTHEAMRTAAAKGHEGAAASKEEVWSELLKKKELGYMAAVRNIGNIVREADDVTFDMLCELLANKHAMKNSKVFPYQVFLPIALMGSGADYSARSAHTYLTRECRGNPHKAQALQRTLTTFREMSAVKKRKLESALNVALDMSAEGLPDIGDNVVIYLDTSGSMRNTFVRLLPMVASLVKMMKGKNFALISFDTDARILNVNPDSTVRDICTFLMNKFNGGATILQQALRIPFSQLGFKPETAILISDMQLTHCVAPTRGHGMPDEKDIVSITTSSYLKDCNIRIAFNVDGEVVTCAPQGEWMTVAGYSSNIFDVFDVASKGATFVDLVNQYQY